MRSARLPSGKPSQYFVWGMLGGTSGCKQISVLYKTASRGHDSVSGYILRKPEERLQYFLSGWRVFVKEFPFLISLIPFLLCLLCFTFLFYFAILWFKAIEAILFSCSSPHVLIQKFILKLATVVPHKPAGK